MLDDYFRDALEYDGTAGALDYLANAQHLMSFDSTQLNLESLCAWGLEMEVADAVLKSDPAVDHLEIEYIVASQLAQHNEVSRSIWEERGWYWPSFDRPIDTEFDEYPSSLFYQQRPTSDEQLRRFVLTARNDLGSLQWYLTAVPEDRFLVFHGCSWDSVRSICVMGSDPLYGPTGRPTDFGKGLYVTRDPEYAHWWALRPGNLRMADTPAIIVFSLPRDYKNRARVMEVAGETWKRCLRHFRKKTPVRIEGLSTAEIIEGLVCKDISSVNKCTSEPSPMRYHQMAFKHADPAELLRLEKVIVFRRSTRYPE